jgi:hypothetical protein
MLKSHSLEFWPRGLSCPLRARSTSDDRGRKGSCAHVMPLCIFVDHGSSSFASSHHRAPGHVETSWSCSRGRRFGYQR